MFVSEISITEQLFDRHAIYRRALCTYLTGLYAPLYQQYMYLFNNTNPIDLKMLTVAMEVSLYYTYSCMF